MLKQLFSRVLSVIHSGEDYFGYAESHFQQHSLHYEQQEHFQSGFSSSLTQGVFCVSSFSNSSQQNLSSGYSTSSASRRQFPHHTAATVTSSEYHSSGNEYHGMNFTVPQGKNFPTKISADRLSSGHGQNSNFGNQQWDRGHSVSDYQRQSQQHGVVLTLASQPGTPSPAHTTSPSIMSGQYPAHHHSRHPLGSPQHGQAHALGAWSHSPVAQPQGMGMHPGAGMGLASQGPGYYPPPHPSMMGASRSLQGPPQHAHMSSSTADRLSPHHHSGIGAWNNLGLPPSKSPGIHEHGRTSSSRSPGGSSVGGNPLFSLSQMLVNQDINRNAIAAAQASYVGLASMTTQQESVDLSQASSEAYSRIPQQLGPIPLTRAEKQIEQSSMRNGSILLPPSNLTTSSSPLNGELGCDSNIQIYSSAVESSPIRKEDFGKVKHFNEGGGLLMPKETVSVIAQTPPRERTTPHSLSPPQADEMPNSFAEVKSECKREKDADTEDEDGIEPLVIDIDYNKPVKEEDQDDVKTDVKLDEYKSSLEDKSLLKHETADESLLKESDISSSNRATFSPSKKSEDTLSAPVSCKDFTSPVRSPKSGSSKRAMKVDSILENLVENGARKSSVISDSVEQAAVPTPVVSVAPASVIVSPVPSNEELTGDSDACSSSNSSHQRVKSPSSKDEEEFSPSSGNGDDTDNSKPRRKRKPEKPVRVTSSGDTEVDKSSESSSPRELCNNTDTPVEREDETSNVIVIDDSSESKSVNSEKVIDEASEEHLTEKLAKTFPSLIVDNVNLNSSSDQQTSNVVYSISDSEQSDKSSPESNSEVKNPFTEVESELEKMFAGIVENENSSQDPLNFDSGSVKESPRDVTPGDVSDTNRIEPEDKPQPNILKCSRPKGKRIRNRRSSESMVGGSSTSEITPKKKKKKKKQMRMAVNESPGPVHSKSKRTKKFQGTGKDSSIVCDSGFRSRGPVIHIEGPKDSPYVVTVINAPSKLEDEDGADRGNNKKLVPSSSRRKNANYHNDLEYRGKVTRSRISGLGMFSSTLSTRYDAHTPDRTWVCVFCKHGPHAGHMGLGDLFGPYLIGKDKSETVGQFNYCDLPVDDKDITEEQKKDGRNKRSIRQADLVEQFRHKMSKKARRSSHSIENSQILGIMLVPPDKNDPSVKEDSYEVWVHEDCVAWAGGVHMVGSRVVGLQEAVWSAVKSVCGRCGIGGACVGCIQRGCQSCMHVVCAKEYLWELDEGTYVARCRRHKKGTVSPESILPT